MTAFHYVLAGRPTTWSAFVARTERVTLAGDAS